MKDDINGRGDATIQLSRRKKVAGVVSCGCYDGVAKLDPFAERPCSPASAFSSHGPGRDARLAKEQRGSAFHEAGHALAGIVLGSVSIEYATTGGGRPHVRHRLIDHDLSDINGAFRDAMLLSIAGSIGEGIGQRWIVCPSAEELQPYILRSSEGGLGSCDRCHEARLLRSLAADKTNAELIAQWRDAFRLCLAVFDHDEWRCHLRQIAAALEERILLTGDELLAMIDLPAIRATVPWLSEEKTS